MTRLMDVVVARHDYVPTEEGCIQLHRGDIILVVNQDNSGWWDGILYENRERGWFPSEYVMTAPQDVVDKVISEQSAGLGPSGSDSDEKVTESGEEKESDNEAVKRIDSFDSAASNQGLVLTANNHSMPNIQEHNAQHLAGDLATENKPDESNKILPNSSRSLTNLMNGLTIDTSVASTPSGRLASATQPRTAPVQSSASILPMTPMPHQHQQSQQQQQQLQQQQQQQAVPVVSLQMLIDNILQPIAELRNMQTLNGDNCINFTNNVVRAVRNLLYHTGVKGEESPALAQYPELRNVRQNLFISLNRLVAVCKIIAHQTPPPSDTLTNMHTHALGVLEHVKAFILMATELQLELITEPPPPPALHGIARTQSANAVVAHQVPLGQRHVSRSISSDKFPPNVFTSQQGSVLSPTHRSPLATPTTPFVSDQHSHAYHHSIISSEAAELCDLMVQSAGTIKNVLERLMAQIESGKTDSTKLQLMVRETVHEVGQLFSLIGDNRTPHAERYGATDDHDWSIRFSENCDRLFAEIKSMHSAGAALDQFPADGALEYLRTCILRVRNALNDVVLSGRQKFAYRIAAHRREEEEEAAALSHGYSTNATDSISSGSYGRKSSEPMLRTSSGNPVLNNDNPPATMSTGSLGRKTQLANAPKYGMSRERVGSASAAHDMANPMQSPTNRRATDTFSRSPTNTGSNTKMMKLFGVDTPRVPPPALSTQKPKFLLYEYEEGDIRYNMENQISGGTWPALVERLTPHDTAKDEEYVNIFFLTFRCFASPEKLADQLLERYRIKPPKGLSSTELKIWSMQKQKTTRIRVIHMVKTWLEKYFFHGKDEVALPKLRELVTMNAKISPNTSNPLLELIDRKAKESHMTSIVSSIGKMSPRTARHKQLDRFTLGSRDSTGDVAPPSPNLPRHISIALKTRNLVNVTDIDPLEMARQLTIIDSKQFCAIQPYELIDQEFTRKDSRVAVNVRGMSDLSNQIITWTAESILFEDDLKKRASILKYYIKLADKCLSLNNYNTMMAILSAIRSAPIDRLRKTWELIPNKTKYVLQSLQQKVDRTKNYKEYRERIRQLPPPCIPFFGIFLTDIIFTADGNPDYKDRLVKSDDQKQEKLINFEKYRSMVKIIQNIQSFQVTYNLTPVDEMQDYLRERLGASKTGGNSDRLYEMSLIIEPKDEPATMRPSFPPPPLPQSPTEETVPTAVNNNSSSNNGADSTAQPEPTTAAATDVTSVNSDVKASSPVLDADEAAATAGTTACTSDESEVTQQEAANNNGNSVAVSSTPASSAPAQAAESTEIVAS
ncbi:ras guanine nucleotide exchange factor domain-containing protein [Syncephalis plumigaleata]|nr:ras guanine nucleotide exchange factor domain-containing protein [Syncephalis plumigaleata]